MNRVLVTGGAGYIGSHVAKLLGRNGNHVVTLDNLSKGYAGSVVAGRLVVGDTGNKDLVTQILRDEAIDTVMHFAAWTIVPESVAEPLKYYLNNTCNARTLIECCVENGVRNFVFSSTAAVYGVPEESLCRENTPTLPINPYGSSKLMAEQMLRDACAASDMRHIILRYFNVAGCDPDGEIGQSTEGATLLIKVACEAATGKRDGVHVFGTDYDTPDGTGIRDYIHVQDLAAAHSGAMKYLNGGGESATLNCGYGHGYSVREVLDTVQQVAGQKLNIVESDRRAGAPPSLIADCSRLRSMLDWAPHHEKLEQIVKDALFWERKIAAKQVKDGRAID